MKVVVIGGTGGQGLGIATRFAKAGEDVIIGSRTLDKAEAAVVKVKELLGNIKNVRAAENPDAAKEADVLILTCTTPCSRGHAPLDQGGGGRKAAYGCHGTA